MKRAVADLSWLRTRGYAQPSAVKLVGDRYQLRQRQRVAVGRCACGDEERESRARRQLEPNALSGQRLAIDGLNVITTLEVALAGAVVLQGRDGCWRDMASFHGSYRLVRETERAVRMLVDVVASLSPSEAVLYIDRPVSNSGRLAELVRRVTAESSSNLEAWTADRVDETLQSGTAVVATADSAILDACESWVCLARIAIERHRREVEPMWLLDLS